MYGNMYGECNFSHSFINIFTILFDDSNVGLQPHPPVPVGITLGGCSPGDILIVKIVVNMDWAGHCFPAVTRHECRRVSVQKLFIRHDRSWCLTVMKISVIMFMSIKNKIPLIESLI